MDQSVLVQSTACFLFLMACLFISCGSTQEHLRGGKRIYDRTKRSYGDRVSCRSKNQECFGNRTIFDTLSGCHCDEACYKIFSDCCPDYQKQCGRQESFEPKTSMWKCVEFADVQDSYGCDISGATGVWMISQCPSGWPFNESRTRCENAPSEFSYPAEDYIPVVGENSLTYRNKYCALCNGVENYNSWNMKVATDTYVIPPEELDLNSKLKFIENNGGGRMYVSAESGQPRRVCFEGNYIDSCFTTNASLYKACVEGPVEVVTWRDTHFKNYACAKCNGREVTSYDVDVTCGTESAGFSIVFNIRKVNGISKTSTVVASTCPYGNVYDTNLHFCRIGHVITSSGELNNEYLIILWFKLLRIMSSYTYEYFLRALISEFSLERNQIGGIYFYYQGISNIQRVFVATFRLTLTPFQTIIKANQYKPFFNVPDANAAFLRLFKMTGGFTLSWKKYSFPVIKMNSKPLSCFSKENYRSNEYEILEKNGSFIVNKTGKVLSLEDYTLVKEEDGNFTLCRRLVLSDCSEGAYVPLNASEYVIFPNLSVYHNVTESIFNFGEYLIDEINGNSSISNTPANSTLPRNVRISVCSTFRNTFHKTATKYSHCSDGAYVPLNSSEYMIFPNLSVYHNATESIFNFGEYLISETNGNTSISNTTPNSTYPRNVRIAVCLPFKNTFNITVTKYRNSTITTSYGLRILTLVGFIVSIICLLLLLITYGLFRELRTVPGMNLMNLSFSMLLSHLIWLIGTGHFTGTMACRVFAILEHYLFQVSFLAMSVISYHSRLVFSNPFAGRIVNTSWSRFIKYSAFVWVTPALFVAICVTLDNTEAFPVDYGTNCWLGTVNAILYLFLLPLAISLLYNIFIFVQTARLLFHHDETREILQRKEGKQNLLICTKLATLVGFPWLFAFFGVLFPDVEAFEYLFVVFACLQGLYIGMAFLFKKKTLKLYKNRWNIGSRGHVPAYNAAPTVEMT